MTKYKLKTFSPNETQITYLRHLNLLNIIALFFKDFQEH